MKRVLSSLVALTAFGLSVVGCSGTAEGVASDTSNTANAVSNAPEAVANAASNTVNAAANVADNAGEAVAGAASNAANAASNVGSAAVVTSQVKLAIAANKQLNDSANEINVDTKDGKIVLRGHVKTAELKKTAQTIAEKVKKDRSFSETIVNQLTVG